VGSALHGPIRVGNPIGCQQCRVLGGVGILQYSPVRIAWPEPSDRHYYNGSFTFVIATAALQVYLVVLLQWFYSAAARAGVVANTRASTIITKGLHRAYRLFALSFVHIYE